MDENVLLVMLLHFRFARCDMQLLGFWVNQDSSVISSLSACRRESSRIVCFGINFVRIIISNLTVLWRSASCMAKFYRMFTLRVDDRRGGSRYACFAQNLILNNVSQANMSVNKTYNTRCNTHLGKSSWNHVGSSFGWIGWRWGVQGWGAVCEYVPFN